VEHQLSRIRHRFLTKLKEHNGDQYEYDNRERESCGRVNIRLQAQQDGD